MATVQETELLRRYGRKVVYLLTGGLEHLVAEGGGTCLGISIRSTAADTLVVIRADVDGTRMVAFMGGSTAAGALCKVEHQLRNGGLKWRQDYYHK